MKAKSEAWPELWMSQSVIAASLSVMQTESHSDCPTSQAKGWKTFTCKYEWPTSYCEHASYGILKSQQPHKICHRGLANQQLYCNSTQALEVAIMCVGYQLFQFAFVAYGFVATIVTPRKKQNECKLIQTRNIMYYINRFAVKKLKSSKLLCIQSMLAESTHPWQ